MPPLTTQRFADCASESRKHREAKMCRLVGSRSWKCQTKNFGDLVTRLDKYLRDFRCGLVVLLT